MAADHYVKPLAREANETFGRTRYVLTPDGEHLLQSTTVVDASYRRAVVYLSRIKDSREAGRLSVSADIPAEIRYQDDLATIGITGIGSFPFIRQDGKATVSVEPLGFARIEAPEGWWISD